MCRRGAVRGWADSATRPQDATNLSRTPGDVGRGTPDTAGPRLNVPGTRGRNGHLGPNAGYSNDDALGTGGTSGWRGVRCRSCLHVERGGRAKCTARFCLPERTGAARGRESTRDGCGSVDEVTALRSSLTSECVADAMRAIRGDVPRF